jgi:hypothetical protein
MDERLWKVWRHYLGCRAVGRFPVQEWGEDELVLQHARLLAEVFRLHEESQRRQFELAVIQASMAAGIGAGKR